jgi:hypothetical protein
MAVRQPGSFQPGAVIFLPQREGSDCGRLADLDAGWNRNRYRFAGATNTSYRSFSATFLFFSVLAICPGFYFRLHYFTLVLPAVSLLAGVAISRLSDLSVDRLIVVRSIPILILGLALAWPMLAERKFFFEASPVDASRMIYSESPFPESIRIAEYLREHTTRNDTIAVLGSEPQIYFYSDRHSATGYVYTYGLMEP